ncbi:MAG: DUF6785 family protein [Phycisphaeraceae bacterium]
MSFRAVILGLAIGLTVASFAYFNDWVMRQTQIVGNYLPISVFGAAMVLLLANIALASVRQRWAFRPAEIAIVIAVALAACAWPASGFGRYYPIVTTMPNYWQATQPHWQAANVMSYVPGGSGRVALGHVQDWATLTAMVDRGRRADQPSVGGQLWRETDSLGRQLWNEAIDVGRPATDSQTQMVAAINRALASNGFYRDELLPEEPGPRLASWLARRNEGELAAHEQLHLNRALLAEASGGAVMHPPDGWGVLLAGGRIEGDRYMALVQGDADTAALSLELVDWRQWVPTALMWGGTAFTLGMAVLCLALIVHPQWSRRELLPYPISRFVDEVTARREGARVPDILHNRLFWYAFGAVAALHLLNGSSAWIDRMPVLLPLNFDFSPLRDLFPYASRAGLSQGYFEPRLFLTPVAFAFFIPASVSFSLGISHLLYIMVSAAFIGQGISFPYNKGNPNPANFLRLGAYVAMAMAIFYNGRRYYTNVMASAIGLPRSSETPTYAPWAARLFVLFSLGAIWLLASSGLDWTLATIFILIAILTHLVLSRILCETGAFGLSSPFLPIGVMLGLLGFEAMGPTGLLLVALASWIIIPDPREIMMPYINTALDLGDRQRVRVAKLAAPLTLMSLLAIVASMVGGAVVLHRYGALSLPGYMSEHLPKGPFNVLTREHGEAQARLTLAEATSASGWEKLALLNPDAGAYLWVLVGLGLVLATAAIRLRFPKSPLHPVTFLVWGTWAIAQFAFSFLIGWMVRAAVVQLGGAQAFHRLKPFMVGIIAGELVLGLFWMIFGAVYFFITGQIPASYSIFPA